MLEDQTLHQSSSSGSSKPHSVKVPRLYKVAANILRDFDDGKDSIKNLVFNCRYYSDGLRFFLHNIEKYIKVFVYHYDFHESFI